MTANKIVFARRLRAGDPLTGLIVKMPCAALLEVAGHLGFDFAVIDTEHGPAEIEGLEHHLRAADSVGLPTLVRVATGGRDEILHALDAGAAGIVAPHVNDAEGAERIVRAAHYPPRGARGLATSTRAGRHGTRDVADHIRHAAETTIVVVQVEDVAAVPNAAEIAVLPGVDAVFLGPSDLSLSLGHPGDLEHPDVAAAIEQVASAVTGTTGAALFAVVGDEDEARAWRSRGAQLLVFVAPSVIAKRLGSLIQAVNGTAQTGLVSSSTPTTELQS